MQEMAEGYTTVPASPWAADTYVHVKWPILLGILGIFCIPGRSEWGIRQASHG